MKIYETFKQWHLRRFGNEGNPYSVICQREEEIWDIRENEIQDLRAKLERSEAANMEMLGIVHDACNLMRQIDPNAFKVEDEDRHMIGTVLNRLEMIINSSFANTPRLDQIEALKKENEDAKASCALMRNCLVILQEGYPLQFGESPLIKQALESDCGKEALEEMRKFREDFLELKAKLAVAVEGFNRIRESQCTSIMSQAIAVQTLAKIKGEI